MDFKQREHYCQRCENRRVCGRGTTTVPDCDKCKHFTSSKCVGLKCRALDFNKDCYFEKPVKGGR